MKSTNKTLQNNISDREVALEAIVDLRKKYGDKGSSICGENEAKTRLLIIDDILEALGWSKEDFNPEHSVKHGDCKLVCVRGQNKI